MSLEAKTLSELTSQDLQELGTERPGKAQHMSSRGISQGTVTRTRPSPE